jgi:hypothetical protein
MPRVRSVRTACHPNGSPGTVISGIPMDGPSSRAENCWSSRPAPGEPAMVEHGRVGPAVTQIALIQDGHEDCRPLESHFGAWVVCTEQASPFQVAALDKNGTVLASIEESSPPQ